MEPQSNPDGDELLGLRRACVFLVVKDCKQSRVKKLLAALFGGSNLWLVAYSAATTKLKEFRQVTSPFSTA